MGVSSREKGVLKLVHPGRHVEIHRQPVAASEIMRKYPRHCIARPDVFKYPYIVVRPESVLLPGKVFYLVPNRTLYNLLKARAQNSCQENHPPQGHDRRGHARQDSGIRCWGGKAPAQLHDRGHRRRWKNMLGDRSNSYVQDSEGYNSDTSYIDAWNEISNKVQNVHLDAPKRQLHDRGHRLGLMNMLGDRSNSYVHDSEDYTSDTSYVDVWNEISDKARNAHLDPHPDDSSFNNSISLSSKRYHYNGNKAISSVSITGKGYNVTSAHSIVRDEGKRISGDQRRMKSCIRKKDSARKLNLKVTFSSPIIIPRLSGRSSSLQQQTS